MGPSTLFFNSVVRPRSPSCFTCRSAVTPSPFKRPRWPTEISRSVGAAIVCRRPMPRRPTPGSVATFLQSACVGSRPVQRRRRVRGATAFYRLRYIASIYARRRAASWRMKGATQRGSQFLYASSPFCGTTLCQCWACCSLCQSSVCPSILCRPTGPIQAWWNGSGIGHNVDSRLLKIARN